MTKPTWIPSEKEVAKHNRKKQWIHRVVIGQWLVFVVVGAATQGAIDGGPALAGSAIAVLIYPFAWLHLYLNSPYVSPADRDKRRVAVSLITLTSAALLHHHNRQHRGYQAPYDPYYDDPYYPRLPPPGYRSYHW